MNVRSYEVLLPLYVNYWSRCRYCFYSYCIFSLTFILTYYTLAKLHTNLNRAQSIKFWVTWRQVSRHFSVWLSVYCLSSLGVTNYSFDSIFYMRCWPYFLYISYCESLLCGCLIVFFAFPSVCIVSILACRGNLVLSISLLMPWFFK